MAELSTYSRADLAQVKQLALAGITSQHTRRAYNAALDRFLAWYEEAGRPALAKHVLETYKAEMVESGLSAASVNQHLAVCRRLVREIGDAGLISHSQAESIAKVRGVRQRGQRLGNWLAQEQAQELLDAPNVKTLRGKRDQAILGVLLGTGLRRSEIANLTFSQIQQREGRWVLIDLVGKGGRVRSVPMPSWAKVAVDVWAKGAGLDSGRVFRSMRKGDRLDGDSMSDEAVRAVVAEYAEAIGLKSIATHDLRRSFAHLALNGGARIEQIGLSLGHASIATTERYLGVKQDLQDSPADRINLRVRKNR